MAPVPASADLPRQGFIERAWLGLVFFLPLVFGPGLSDTFALPKVTLLRCACALLAAACLRRIFHAGRFPIKGSALNAPLLSFLTAVLVSALFSDFPSAGFWGMAGDYSEGWTSLLCFLFLFWAASSWLDEESAETTLRFMVYSAAIAAFYGLLQAGGVDFFVWRDGQAAFGRPWSSLGNPNFFGAFLAMAAPLSLDAALAKPGLRRALPAVLILAVLPYTFSQAAGLGFLAGLAVWIAWRRRSVRENGRRIAALFLAAGIIVLGLWALRQQRRPTPERPDRGLAAQIATKASLTGSSVRGRLILWKTAGRMFVENPILGVGPSSFVYQFKRWMPPEFETAVSEGLSASHAHNEAVNTAVSLGFLGLLAYAWIVWRLFRIIAGLAGRGEAGAGPAAALAAVWINNQFSFHTVTTAAYAFILLGLLVRHESAREEPLRSFSPRPWLGKSLPALACAAALVAAAASFSFFAANRFHRMAEDAYRSAGDWRRAVRLARWARRLDPWSYSYPVALGRLLQEGVLKGGTFQEKEACFQESVEAYESVARRAPLHALAQNGLGVTFIHAAGQFGAPLYFQEAENRFRLALEADPYLAEGISNLAGSLYLQGRKREAADVYRQAIEKRPKTAWLRLELGDFYAQEGLEDEAILEWQRALRYDSENEAAKQRLARVWAKEGE